MKSLFLITLSLLLFFNISKAQSTYVWNTSDGSWVSTTNWLPPRNTPAVDDILIFNSGATHIVTDVPTQIIGALTLTNNTSVSLQATATSKTLTIGNALINYLTVETGSLLEILNNSGILLNISINTGSQASIGGSVVMHSGNFAIGDNTLHLHSSSVPIDRVNGQFSIGLGGTLQFGGVSNTSGPIITLPNNIFVSPPTISNLIINRTNGVALGNQSIIINNTTTMTLGDLVTNSSGRVRFSSTATAPLETVSSKIVGYAEMLPRVVGTSLLSFLGFELVSGTTTDIGTINFLRKTGIDGINTFNGFESIASTWDITVSIEPTGSGRLLSLSWFDDFDNTTMSTSQFQAYRFDSGPDWTAVGSLANLQVTTDPRIITPVSAFKLSGSWTVADENNALPITLTDFDGKLIKEGILLQWETHTEINGDIFEIQRLNEADNSFDTIGVVEAAGNSTNVLQYTYLDKDPLRDKNYYRLKLVDVDGKFEYSKLIVINNLNESSNEDLLVYPNPNYGTPLHIVSPTGQSGHIILRDMSGAEILRFKGSVLNLNLPDSRLPSGIYLAEFLNEHTRSIKRLVIYN